MAVQAVDHVGRQVGDEGDLPEAGRQPSRRPSQSHHRHPINLIGAPPLLPARGVEGPKSSSPRSPPGDRGPSTRTCGTSQPEGTPYDFRQPRTIGTTSRDHALTGLARDHDGRAWAHLTANGGPGTRVGLWAGQGYRWLQVFTGDPLEPDRRREAVAIEPMTCPPNAFVTGDDLLILEPGQAVTHTWGIRVLNGGDRPARG